MQWWFEPESYGNGGMQGLLTTNVQDILDTNVNVSIEDIQSLGFTVDNGVVSITGDFLETIGITSFGTQLTNGMQFMKPFLYSQYNINFASSFKLISSKISFLYQIGNPGYIRNFFHVVFNHVAENNAVAVDLIDWALHIRNSEYNWEHRRDINGGNCVFTDIHKNIQYKPTSEGSYFDRLSAVGIFGNSETHHNENSYLTMPYPTYAVKYNNFGANSGLVNDMNYLGDRTVFLTKGAFEISETFEDHASSKRLNHVVGEKTDAGISSFVYRVTNDDTGKASITGHVCTREEINNKDCNEESEDVLKVYFDFQNKTDVTIVLVPTFDTIDWKTGGNANYNFEDFVNSEGDILNSVLNGYNDDILAIQPIFDMSIK